MLFSCDVTTRFIYSIGLDQLSPIFDRWRMKHVFSVSASSGFRSRVNKALAWTTHPRPSKLGRMESLFKTGNFFPNLSWTISKERRDPPEQKPGDHSSHRENPAQNSGLASQPASQRFRLLHTPLPLARSFKHLYFLFLSLIYYHSSKKKKAWVDGVAIKVGTYLWTNLGSKT